MIIPPMQAPLTRQVIEWVEEPGPAQSASANPDLSFHNAPTLHSLLITSTSHTWESLTVLFSVGS